MNGDPGDDIRNAVEEAFNAGGAEAGDGGAGEAAAGSESAAVDTVEAGDSSGAGEAVSAVPVTDSPAGADSRARGADGKFVKREAAAPAAKAEAQQPKPAATQDKPPEAQAAPPPTVKAPQSWKPLAREAFARASPEVQQEVMRRESEIQRTLQQTAQARQAADSWQKVLGPYEGAIRAEGGDPMATVAGLLQTSMALRTAPPAHKAQLVAKMVQNFGVPIELLDQALAGTAPTGGSQPPPQQDVASVVRAQLAQMMAQSQASRAQADLAKFMADPPEFLEDVKADMADMLEIAQRRGVALSLQDAYARAVKLNPDIAAVSEQRQAGQRAASLNGSTQRAKSAGGSLKPSAAPVTAGEEAEDIRSIVAKAMSAR